MNYQKNNLIKFFIIAAAITGFLLLLNVFLGPQYGGDIEWYIKAAEGHLSELIQPYSARFLHPFIVGLLSSYSPLDTYQSFSVVAIVSFFGFLVINIKILADTIKNPFFFLPLFLLPVFFDNLRYIFHPDTFYIFLTALFLLWLYYEKEIVGLLVLFLLFLTRESTIILGLVLTVVSWIRSRKMLAATILAVILISLFTTSAISAVGQPNIHNLSSSTYLIAKLSYNFMNNVLGLKPWANTYQNCEPVFKLDLSPPQSFGSIREVGLCGFNIMVPMQTLITLLTIFGIAPLALFYILKNRASQTWQIFPLWFLVALIYGLIIYFIGIVAGTGVARIVGYGWPAFLLATPILISKFFELDKKFITKLVLAHFFVAWLPFIAYRIFGEFANFLILGTVLIVYFYCFRIIKNQKKKAFSVQDIDFQSNTL